MRSLNDEQINHLLFGIDHQSDTEDEDNPALELEPEFSCIANDDQIENEEQFFETISELDPQSEQNIGPIIRHRKLLTRNKIINSLEKSLDHNNYNLISLPNEEIFHKVILDKGNKNRNEASITWTNKKPVNTGRQSSENIVKTRGGVLGSAKNAMTPIECCNIFISADIINKIVNYTNKRIEMMPNIGSSTKPAEQRTTNIKEMNAFIGLMYARGLLNRNFHDISKLYEKVTGNPYFVATMS